MTRDRTRHRRLSHLADSDHPSGVTHPPGSSSVICIYFTLTHARSWFALWSIIVFHTPFNGRPWRCSCTLSLGFSPLRIQISTDPLRVFLWYDWHVLFSGIEVVIYRSWKGMPSSQSIPGVRKERDWSMNIYHVAVTKFNSHVMTLHAVKLKSVTKICELATSFPISSWYNNESHHVIFYLTIKWKIWNEA